jgi:hypothetical protein
LRALKVFALLAVIFAAFVVIAIGAAHYQEEHYHGAVHEQHVTPARTTEDGLEPRPGCPSCEPMPATPPAIMENREEYGGAKHPMNHEHH